MPRVARRKQTYKEPDQRIMTFRVKCKVCFTGSFRVERFHFRSITRRRLRVIDRKWQRSARTAYRTALAKSFSFLKTFSQPSDRQKQKKPVSNRLFLCVALGAYAFIIPFTPFHYVNGIMNAMHHKREAAQ